MATTMGWLRDVEKKPGTDSSACAAASRVPYRPQSTLKQVLPLKDVVTVHIEPAGRSCAQASRRDSTSHASSSWIANRAFRSAAAVFWSRVARSSHCLRVRGTAAEVEARG